MKITETQFNGIFEVTLEPREDHRGFFMRTYDEQLFRDHGSHRQWVQENHSFTKQKGTLRGLHFQFPPDAETKLVRVISGEVFMAYVDLRRDSSSFGKWGQITLSADNHKALYVARGFALGMCTLADNSTLLYKMDNYYAPANQGVVRWNDPLIGIDWPVSSPILSERDEAAPGFRDFCETVVGLDLE